MTQDNRSETCSTCSLQELALFLEQSLPQRRRQWLEQHLRECATCRRSLHELAAVRALLRHTPRMDPPRSFALSERDVRSYRRVLWYPALRAATTVIAILVLVLSAAGLLQVGPQQAPAPSPRPVAVAPEITRRMPPTAPAQRTTSAPPTATLTYSPAQTAYPLPDFGPQETVTQPTAAPTVPQQEGAFGAALWKTAQFVGLFLLGLSVVLTVLAYRAERIFFS